MVCVYCGTKLVVNNSRPQKRANTVWRRRACPHCQAVFTSVESIDLASGLLYRDAQKRVQPFSRDSLYISVYEACRHRKTAATDARALTDTIISDLLPQSHNATLERQQVVTATTAVLGRFDPAAGSAYAAYHPN